MTTQFLGDRVWAWVQQCQRHIPEGSSYVFSATSLNPTVMSLSFAVLTAELYDMTPVRQREGWQDYLQSLQDRASGLFLDPLLSSDDLESSSPGEDYLQYQTNYFALNALDALGCKPIYSLRFVELFGGVARVEEWLEHLDWSQPWRESNWVMFVASGLFLEWQWDGNHAAHDSINHILDWLDLHQDPDTGFWGMADGATLLDAMAGAYHFLPYYFALGRPIQFPDKMIESTLSLQHSDGLFHPDGGGDACLDVDAVDILVKCSLVTEHLSEGVYSALKRAFDGLVKNQSDDGGFCRARQKPLPPKSRKRRFAEQLGLDRLMDRPYIPPREIRYYSGWTEMPFDIRESDLWSTWFRSYGLALISTRYPESFPVNARWQFRRVPALGWHSAAQVTSCGL